MSWLLHRPQKLMSPGTDAGEGAGSAAKDPPAAGAAGAGNQAAGGKNAQAGTDPTAGANAGTPKPDEAKFTQADLDRVAGQTRKDAKQSAQADLLKQLGVADIDAAKTALADADKLRKAQMTDQERLATDKAEAEKSANEARAALQQAQQERRAALLEAEVVSFAAGRFIDPKAVIKLADLSKVKFEDSKFTGVDTALDALATEKPWTLIPENSVQNQSIGRTNGDGKPKARTDADRKKQYFGGVGTTLFDGGGGVVVNDKKPSS